MVIQIIKDLLKLFRNQTRAVFVSDFQNRILPISELRRNFVASSSSTCAFLCVSSSMIFSLYFSHSAVWKVKIECPNSI